jgi:citrate lyase subunit beta/citryl-CoA lyase
MRLRSPLFAPGDSEKKATRALASAADAVILDLEDSVAPGGKDSARATVAALLPGIARPGVVVRVNPRHTPWYLADLAAVVPGRPAAVMLPKCAGAEDLRALDHHLEALETAAGLEVGGIGVLPIVTESAAAVLALATCPAAARRVLAFCFGAEDLSADLGIDPRRPDGSYPPPVAQARAAVLLMAAAAGLPAIDTPWPNPRDPAGLAREAAEAAADGFAGKLCIHPDQIAPVNAAFSPSAERVAWARRVRAGFAANPDAGVFALDGKMIDRPHLKLAERILAAVEGE